MKERDTSGWFINNECTPFITVLSFITIYTAFTSGASPTVDKKAQGTDASGCPSMEGLLQRKNAHNEWKKRHAKLQGTFFITNKPKHKKPTSEIKENIDLRDVASVGVYDDVLEIEKHNGEMFLYKYDEKDASGGSIDAWYDALNKRHIWAQTQPGGAQNRARSKSEAADPDDWIFEEDRIHVSGYLQKKSHNKYNGMQVRDLLCRCVVSCLLFTVAWGVDVDPCNLTTFR